MDRFLQTLGIALMLILLGFVILDDSDRGLATFNLQIVDAQTDQGLECGRVLTLTLQSRPGVDPIWKFDGGEFKANRNGFVQVHLIPGNYETQITCQGYPVYVETGKFVVDSGTEDYLQGTHNVEIVDGVIVIKINKIPK